MKSISQIATRDITDVVKVERIKFKDSLLDYQKSYGGYDSWDEWFVGASRVFTKESRRLNRVLGIHKVNMGKK